MMAQGSWQQVRRSWEQAFVPAWFTDRATLPSRYVNWEVVDITYGATAEASGFRWYVAVTHSPGTTSTIRRAHWSQTYPDLTEALRLAEAEARDEHSRYGGDWIVSIGPDLDAQRALGLADGRQLEIAPNR